MSKAHLTLKLVETVIISKYKSDFDKGYLPNFTEEYFKIKQSFYKAYCLQTRRLER